MDGLCNCGCGEVTHVSNRNRKELGHIKGRHVPFIQGHTLKKFRGKKPHNWKGGRSIKDDGYILINDYRLPRQNGRYQLVLEHVLVMETHLSRKLTDQEVIHHKDKNPQNNSIENLVLCASQSEHIRKYHKQLRDSKGRFSGMFYL